MEQKDRLQECKDKAATQVDLAYQAGFNDRGEDERDIKKLESELVKWKLRFSAMRHIVVELDGAKESDPNSHPWWDRAKQDLIKYPKIPDDEQSELWKQCEGDY